MKIIKSGSSSPLSDPTITTRIDEADSATTYVGEAVVNSSESDSVWRIKKITVSGTVTSIKWAGGSTAFTNQWSGRTGLTYT